MTNEKSQRFVEWKAAKRNLAVAKRDLALAEVTLKTAKIALNDAVEAETAPLRNAG